MGCMSSKQSRYDEEEWNDTRPENASRDRWARRAQEEDRRNRRAVRGQYAPRQGHATWDLGGGVILEADPNARGAYNLPT